MAAVHEPSLAAHGAPSTCAAPLPPLTAGLLEGPGSTQEGPLLAPQGCARLHHLGLDWLKLRRSCLDRQLALTLAACTALTSLSLMGYQGGIDQVCRGWAG
jgi:hypothetical protein